MNAKDEETRTPPKNSRTSERGTQPVIRNVQGLPRSRNIRENYSKRMNTLDKWAVRVISENIKVHSRAFRRCSLTRESTGSEQIMLWRALSDPRAVLILFPRVFFSFFFNERHELYVNTPLNEKEKFHCAWQKRKKYISSV